MAKTNAKPRPTPQPTPTTQAFWDGAKKGKLMLQWTPGLASTNFGHGQTVSRLADAT